MGHGGGGSAVWIETFSRSVGHTNMMRRQCRRIAKSLSAGSLLVACTFATCGLYGQVQNKSTLTDGASSYGTPHYSHGEQRLISDALTLLAPALEVCYKQDVVVTSLPIALTIDSCGSVVAVRFLRPFGNKFCVEHIRTQMLKWEGWVAAMDNGHPKTGEVVIPISCVRYE